MGSKLSVGKIVLLENFSTLLTTQECGIEIESSRL